MATKVETKNGSHPAYEPPPVLGTKKTLLILFTVVACIAVIWPKLFYPQISTSTDPSVDNYVEKKGSKPSGAGKSDSLYKPKNHDRNAHSKHSMVNKKK